MDRTRIVRRASEIGLSQNDLAAKLNYTRDGLYKAISRDTIPVVKYKLLCELLNVPFGTYLLDEKEEDFVADTGRILVLVDKLEKLIHQYK
jgi:transcriptional regulator with XRE-family HTH domain